MPPSQITATFNSRITGLGGTVIEVPVVNGVGTYAYTDANGNPATLTVERINGSSLGGNTSYPGITHPLWNINPQSSGTDTIPGEGSGLRFTFSSPVNAFGMDIGDWATCCMTEIRPAFIQSTYGVPAQGSGLWIRFNGGTASLPANALTDADNPGYAASEGYVNFIGAVDDSGTFTTIDFWGDGFGEVLYAGGTLRFAAVPRGAISGGRVAQVPAVGSVGLLTGLLGIAGLGLSQRRRRTTQR